VIAAHRVTAIVTRQEMPFALDLRLLFRDLNNFTLRYIPQCGQARCGSFGS